MMTDATRRDGFTLALKTTDAYSAFRYGTAGWATLATLLLAHGLTVEQSEAVLRSKWTRWAADTLNARHGRVSGRKAFAWLLEQRALPVNELTGLVAA